MRFASAAIALGATILSACGEANKPAPADAAAESDAPAAQPSEAPEETLELSCSYPVDGRTDTAQTLLERFGKDAVRATLMGPEGTEWAGVLLWGDDPVRRVEVYLEEGPGERVASVLVRSPEAQWRSAGVGIDGTVAEVTAANGRPFTFWGFSWDYGGWIIDFGGGAFDNLPGGCHAQIRLDLPENKSLPDGIFGEGQLKSADPRVEAATPTVSEIGLSWR